MALPAFPQAMASTAVQLAIVLTPVAIFAVARRSRKILYVAALTFALVSLQSVILFTGNVGCLSTLQYNWLQKFIVFVCVFVLCRPLGVNTKECGFLLPNSRWACAFAVLIGLVYAVIDSFGVAQHQAPTLETVLFQLSMPGLQEEPFFRGLLLCLWDKVLGRPWKVLGVEFGAGCLIATAVFTVGHLVVMDKNWSIVCNSNIFEWLNFVVFCLVMCWLRYRFDSVWPCVLSHNADNGFAKLISLAVAHFHQA